MTTAGSPGTPPNILLIVTDEERYSPAAPGRLRAAGPRADPRARGASFDRYYVASAQCSSSRSVIYTGAHAGDRDLQRRDALHPAARPGARHARHDAALGGLLLPPTRASGTCRVPTETRPIPAPSTDALEPYGFSEFNAWGDIDGGAWAGLKIDPVIAGQAVGWLRDRAPVVDRPWFMAVNFVNPHDIMSLTTAVAAS